MSKTFIRGVHQHPPVTQKTDKPEEGNRDDLKLMRKSPSHKKFRSQFFSLGQHVTINFIGTLQTYMMTMLITGNLYLYVIYLVLLFPPAPPLLSTLSPAYLQKPAFHFSFLVSLFLFSFPFFPPTSLVPLPI